MGSRELPIKTERRRTGDMTNCKCGHPKKAHFSYDMKPPLHFCMECYTSVPERSCKEYKI